MCVCVDGLDTGAAPLFCIVDEVLKLKQELEQ